jgi:hypothetical protein
MPATVLRTCTYLCALVLAKRLTLADILPMLKEDR